MTAAVDELPPPEVLGVGEDGVGVRPGAGAGVDEGVGEGVVPQVVAQSELLTPLQQPP
jgi:hypothetical protein